VTVDPTDTIRASRGRTSFSTRQSPCADGSGATNDNGCTPTRAGQSRNGLRRLRQRPSSCYRERFTDLVVGPGTPSTLWRLRPRSPLMRLRDLAPVSAAATPARERDVVQRQRGLGERGRRRGDHLSVRHVNAATFFGATSSAVTTTLRVRDRQHHLWLRHQATASAQHTASNHAPHNRRSVRASTESSDRILRRRGGR